MQRWADLVLGHRTVVVVLWLLLAVAGGRLAPTTVGALSYTFDLPGEPAFAANTRITAASGGGGANDPVVLVASLPRGQVTAPAAAAAFEEQVAAVAGAVPGTRWVSPATGGGNHLVATDGSQRVALLYPPVVPGPEPYAAALPRLLAAASRTQVAGEPLTVTGTTVLAEGTGSSSDRSVLAETVLGGLGALLVLVLVFTSLLAALPLLVAGVSILATFLALYGLTRVTDISFVVQYLVALIGLGIAIDYSLIIVMRWREERAGGADPTTAVRTAMATAGRSVLFSGLTVAVSLAALVAVPLPFLRSIGLGGLLIPLASVSTALTLVPVVLATVGARLEWPRRRPVDPASRTWRRIATAVVRRPVLAAVASTVLLLALAAPVLGLHLGSPQISTYGSGSPEGLAAQRLVSSGVPAGAVRPLEVLVPTGPGEGAGAGEGTAPADVAARLRRVAGVAAAVVPTGAGWDTDAGQLVQVWTRADPATGDGADTTARVRQVAAAVAADHPLQVGGSPAEDADFVSAVYRNTPWVVAGIVVVTFALLARALRSLWLPVKALVLNVVSLSAAYGVTVAIWQDGVGVRTLFDTAPSGAVTTWVPVAVFAFLFGLSMDYEVFILSRMREAHDAGADTPRAVVEGIARTGRLVTSGALILFLAFIALSTVPSVDVKILATALALGIAIDALVVRALLAPALVVLLGGLNWTMPAPLARFLRIPASGVDDHDPGSTITGEVWFPGRRDRPSPVISDRPSMIGSRRRPIADRGGEDRPGSTCSHPVRSGVDGRVHQRRRSTARRRPHRQGPHPLRPPR